MRLFLFTSLGSWTHAFFLLGTQYHIQAFQSIATKLVLQLAFRRLFQQLQSWLPFD